MPKVRLNRAVLLSRMKVSDSLLQEEGQRSTRLATSKRLRKYQPVDTTEPVPPKDPVGDASTKEHAKNQERPANTASDELNPFPGLSISCVCPLLNKAPREIRNMIYGYLVPSAPFRADGIALKQLRPPRRWQRPFSTVEVAKFLLNRSDATKDGANGNATVFIRDPFLVNGGYTLFEESKQIREKHIREKQVREKSALTLFDVSKRIREESVYAFFTMVQVGALKDKELQHLFKAISSDCIRHLRYINVDWFVFGCVGKWYDNGCAACCIGYLDHKERSRARTRLDDDMVG